MHKTEERFIDGSPRVALTIQHPFNSYTFIEKSPWRVQRLQALQQEFPTRSIRILEDDCNRAITTEVTPRIRYEHFNRGLILLDPFSMNVEWPTIEQIAETKALEVFMNFPVMALNRTALPNDPNTLTIAQIERMNRFWGSTDQSATISTRRSPPCSALSRSRYAVLRECGSAGCSRTPALARCFHMCHRTIGHGELQHRRSTA